MPPDSLSAFLLPARFIERRLLRWGKRSADEFPQLGCSRCQVVSACVLVFFRKGQACVALRDARHATPMPQGRENLKRFAERSVSPQRWLPVRNRCSLNLQATWRDPHGSPALPKNWQRSLVQKPRAGNVTLWQAQMSPCWLIDHAAPLRSPAPRKSPWLLPMPSERGIIAANFYHIGKVVKTARNGRPVRKRRQQARLRSKLLVRRNVVACIAGRYSQGIQ